MDDNEQKIRKITNSYYYDQSQILGKGATSLVYKGYCLPQNKVIACKIIKNDIIKNYPGMIERQVQILHKISQNKHPNIMYLYGHQKTDHCYYLFLEFCPKNLAEQIKHKKITELAAVEMVHQIFEAMDFFNNQFQAHMLHRDLKPENILIDQNRNIKIADFGLARELGLLMSQKRGSLLYRAPEVDKGNNYDIKCDVWSVGLIIYQMLIGQRLFNNYSAGQTNISVNLPQNFQLFWTQLLKKMLKVNKDERPTFHELKIYFESNKKLLILNITQKYGYNSSKFSSNSYHSSSLISSISPSNIGKSSYDKSSYDKSQYGFDSILGLIKQEKSYKKIDKIRKYLVFQSQINEFYLWPVKKLTKIFQWKNPHYYFIALFGLLIYLARQKKFLRFFQTSYIKTESQGIIDCSDVVENHQDILSNLLNQFKTNFDHEKEKFQAVLNTQILNKIRQYQQRPEYKQIYQKNPIISTIVIKIRQKIEADTYYIEQYKKFINKEPYHRRNHIIQFDDIEHMRLYYQLRLIAYVDAIFPQSFFVHEQKIRRKKQEIHNMTKAELYLKIKQVNKQE